MSTTALRSLGLNLFGTMSIQGKELTERHYEPKVDASGVSRESVAYYTDLLRERIKELPEYFGRLSNRLNSYANQFSSRLRGMVYKIRNHDKNLGGYFNPENDELVLNAAHANTHSGRHSATHETVHYLQKITGAIKTIEGTLAKHYSNVGRKIGEYLERYGFRGAKQAMEERGKAYGMGRARAIIEGSASAATSLYEGDRTNDAYHRYGLAQKMGLAIQNLGLGPVLAPKSYAEVLAVDSYLS